jgi:hypothetical protein
MSRALRQLMLMQLRGLLRRGLRQIKTPRGALFFGFGLLVFVLWLLPVVIDTTANPRPRPKEVRNVMPLVLLGITLLTTLTSAGEKAIAFTGGEVDLLFPGPFTRRELLLFKLTKGSFISLLSAIIVSIAIYRNSSHWIACYIGCAMSLLFVQFAGMVALLIGDAVGQRARAGGKILFLTILVTLLFLALKSSTGPNGWEELLEDPRAVLQKFGNTDAGKVLLAPFYVLTRVITAVRLGPELVTWVPIAVAMNLILVGLILLLDAQFVEAAAGASERRYERMRRFRTGGLIAAGSTPGRPSGKRARGAMPMLPRWGGAGAIAWRQLTHARRAGRGLVIVLVILAATVGPLLIASARADKPMDVTIPILATLAWVSVLLASVLRFDFRSDLDAMETLKTLPVRPAAIVWGQLIAPTIVMTLIHWVVVAATIIATAEMRSAEAIRSPLLIAAAVALPFNLLMFVAENLIFLLAPTRPTGAGPGDFSLLGKQIFTLVIRTAGVGVAATIATLFAVMAYLLSARLGENAAIVTATGTAFLVLVGEAIAAVPLVAIAFRRFDPSVHMPA